MLQGLKEVFAVHSEKDGFRMHKECLAFLWGGRSRNNKDWLRTFENYILNILFLTLHRHPWTGAMLQWDNVNDAKDGCCFATAICLSVGCQSWSEFVSRWILTTPTTTTDSGWRPCQRYSSQPCCSRTAWKWPMNHPKDCEPMSWDRWWNAMTACCLTVRRLKPMLASSSASASSMLFVRTQGFSRLALDQIVIWNLKRPSWNIPECFQCTPI